MYRLRIDPSARKELDQAPVFYRRIIEDTIESRLGQDPEGASKNRKPLQPLVAGFEHEDPLWELRVGEWRVFYDIDAEARTVVVRAVRKKPRQKRTEEIV